MSRIKILAIIGARPQFIKHFPFEKACEGKLHLKTIHTGQHFDENMSKVFFDQLGMKQPDYMLANGGGNHGYQTGKMMMDLESIVVDEKPDVVLVYGDTNSTLAGALVAAKLNIPVAHIEAGLRSYNREMPEEINRVLTDHISAWLFTPGDQAVNNLQKEGITAGVHLIGDVMKDMVQFVQKSALFIKPILEERYVYVTLHRPYNVDQNDRLLTLLQSLNSLSQKIVFSIHPRTRSNAVKFGINLNDYSNILFIDPQPYFENLGYIYYADALITDSGGMQKEAYWLKKKCITIRKETEWKETLEGGGNVLIFEDLGPMQHLLESENVQWNEQLYGNGNACEKIVEILLQNYNRL
ncbi:MAG TPA: UDP-N-acetylglucosamine 2-epimerase (non-hydrolyzing) [Saprospiraceae bacterium]|nr:UDP-N-acetylglucosamine 2-epimerase (non-hydrolyzing) [Saprospiraceae bacterium]